MRKISANYIFPISSPPIKNGIIVLDDNNKIIDIINNGGELKETYNLEFYNGILVPGFVNTHCHLELSHLKNKVADKQGMPAFIEGVQEKRNKDVGVVKAAIADADKQMQKNGIVAVGDISNSDISLETKQKSKIYYHTFAEVFGLNDSKTEVIFESAEKIINNIKGSVVPHAPYSVSEKLFNLIKSKAEKENSVISIHNQESKSENELFENNSGNLYDFFLQRGFISERFSSTNKNSLQSVIELLPKKNVILVHNTFSQELDINLCKSYFDNNYWALCPNSNLFIENKLPNLDLFKNHKENLVIGTDSLASNTELSILSEIKIISKKYSDFSIEDLLKFATLNGAKSLKIDKKYGSLDVGKTPGINLITSVNLKKMVLTSNSKITVLA